MCKNNDNARKIAAAARTYLTGLFTATAEYKPEDRKSLFCSTLIPATIAAYESAGIFDATEAQAWVTEWNHMVARGTVETAVCDDCGATIPTDLVTVLGDGDLCLCAGCKDRTCGPLTSADAEHGWDGFGDFEDTPDFQRGHPTELD